ncbi:hypothetical protein F2Q68_00044718 [Brassica cretica]|uniref:Uncharacterized protein n=1 Tax=Brassica cretica TaxID=69181 RepID=A0A8S9LLM7_BRACR|nr:hypothetical protein F2Q68_00044718 [Brassica cretica]
MDLLTLPDTFFENKTLANRTIFSAVAVSPSSFPVVVPLPNSGFILSAMDSGEPPPQSKFQAPTEFPSLPGVKNKPSPSTVLVKSPLDVDVSVGDGLHPSTRPTE